MVGLWGWEVVVEGEREETGAVVCEGKGKDVADDVINWVEKCSARGR